MYKINVLCNAFVVRWTKPKLNPNKLQKEQVIKKIIVPQHAYWTQADCQTIDNLAGAARYKSKPTIKKQIIINNANIF